MPRRCATLVGVVLVFAFSIAAPSASALPWEEGKACVADAAAPNQTLIGFDAARVYPTGLSETPKWVITKWRVQVGAGRAPIAQQLLSFQQVSENEDRKTGESAVETVSEGASEFATRLPVEGLHPQVGLRGPAETLYCSGQSGVLSGVVEGDFPVGATRRYEVKSGIGTPLTVTIEPDTDGDGFGDISQDRCTQSYGVHAGCPRVELQPVLAAVTKGTILLDVSVLDPARVRVTGEVGWSAGARRVVAHLDGGEQEVPEGATAQFRVALPKAVRRRLARMTRVERLGAEMRVLATDAGGHPTVRNLRVKLRGRGSLAHHRP